MASVAGVALIIAAIAALFVPYIYHIVWCINAASETGSAIALLIVGIVVAPVGWVHGVSLFMGYTWIGM
jgi:hypothetical protein